MPRLLQGLNCARARSARPGRERVEAALVNERLARWVQRARPSGRRGVGRNALLETGDGAENPRPRPRSPKAAPQARLLAGRPAPSRSACRRTRLQPGLLGAVGAAAQEAGADPRCPTCWEPKSSAGGRSAGCSGPRPAAMTRKRSLLAHGTAGALAGRLAVPSSGIAGGERQLPALARLQAWHAPRVAAPGPRRRRSGHAALPHNAPARPQPRACAGAGGRTSTCAEEQAPQAAIDAPAAHRARQPSAPPRRGAGRGQAGRAAGGGPAWGRAGGTPGARDLDLTCDSRAERREQPTSASRMSAQLRAEALPHHANPS